MTRRFAAAIATLVVAACTTHLVPSAQEGPIQKAPVEIQILAFNDFHGNLEVPPPVEVTEPDGSKHEIVTGGVANLAAALDQLRGGHPNTVTVSAGDTIGASPLISAHYLDEPTIDAMNLLGLEFNSVGNHEFDRGVAELERMQAGGCAKYTLRTPCVLEPFAGARFRYLAANVIGADGKTIFPAIALKRFDTTAGPITIGFIGETLKGTAKIVTPSGVRGLSFVDEAATANALVPKLKAAGADAIVLLIHQGGKTRQFTVGNGCEGFYGDIQPIIANLDPAITTVISGHTHWAYTCRSTQSISPARLLTSAGKYGYFLTEIGLYFDPLTHRLVDQVAHNVIVGNGIRGQSLAEQALVDRYEAAVAPIARQVVGNLTGPATKDTPDGESSAADLIADSMLAATRSSERGGAQLALVNGTGIRVDLAGGDIRYDAAFAMMPFANNLVVMTLSGAQIKAAIEQQYAVPIRAGFKMPSALAPSAGFTYAIDMSRPQGSRVVDMRLLGEPIDRAARYRVAVNNYLASGGDGLTAFTGGTDLTDKDIIDLDALIAWISPGRTPPTPNRIQILSAP